MSLWHLEVELVALVAVVLGLVMLDKAERALKSRLVVRGVVRVRGLHVFRLLGELHRVVAGGALLLLRGLDLLPGPVAGLALHAGRDVAVSEVFPLCEGALGREREERRESREAGDLYSRPSPAELERYNRTLQPAADPLRTLPPTLSPYYRQKVNDYFYR